MKKILLLLIFVFVAMTLLAFDETEGNDTVATANVIPIVVDTVNVIGTITASNIDWFEYYAIAGDEMVVDHNISGLTATIFNVGLDPDVDPPSGTATDGSSFTYFAASTGYSYMSVSYAGTVEYVVHIKNEDNPTLPVEFSSFSAVQTAIDRVNLNWSTSSESNLSGYNVLKSSTGELANSAKINMAQIEPANSSVTTNYVVTDNYITAGDTYHYWIQAVNLDGTSEFHGPKTVTISEKPVTGEVPDVAFKSALIGNYPNPFNPMTKIAFQLHKASQVDVEIYNVKGEKVWAKDMGYMSGAKSHELVWFGKDLNGKDVASGIYMIRLSTDTSIFLHKAVLLK